MAKRIGKEDAASDSRELQALFDRIAAEALAAQPLPAVPRSIAGDSAELQALFDRIAAQVAAE